MPRQLRALDLFCGAGGVTKGLIQAGFNVTGVDIKEQPNYYLRKQMGRFVVHDAMTFPLGGYDFIWASPPCQGYTSMRHAPGAKGAPLLIDAIRERLIAANVYYCIENVEAARWAMRYPIMLCGSMFGLGAQGCQLQRHRLFECNFPVVEPKCNHNNDPVIGIYGGHARRRAASAGGRLTADAWSGGHRAAASEAMGIDWMTLAEISEAIPPAYAHAVGSVANRHIRHSQSTSTGEQHD